MTFRTAAVAGLALLAVAPVSTAGASPTISEYSSGLSANAAPLSIATGPDGNLWFTENGPGSAIGSVTPSGVITSPATAGPPAPLDIAQGPDGKLWFTETGGAGKIGTVDPQTHLVSEYSLSGGSNPVGVIAGPEGDVWFIESGGQPVIVRIVPATHELTEFEVPTKGSKPDGITVGPEEDLWFTESGGPGAIGRLDPRTKIVTEFSEGLTKNSSPSGIATGPEGDIWFTEAVSPGRIGRLNPLNGAITEFSSGLTVGTPQDIATGSDGNLYFTESGANGAVGQITPSGVISEYTEGLTTKSKPWGVTSGPDGNIWFVENANPAKVARLTVAPSVAAQAAEGIASQTAMLTATIGANAQATSYFFEYGTTPAYGSRTVAASAGTAGTPASQSASVLGLTAATTYHFRVVATNPTGTTSGPDATFQTAHAPPTVAEPPSASPPSGAAAKELVSSPGAPQLIGAGVPSSGGAPSSGGDPPSVKPVIGRAAGIEKVSGAVLVQDADGAFVPLGTDATIPIGSVIDSTHGVLRLVTALDSHGRSQSATVWGGVFQVAQSRSGNGLTGLVLRGPPLSCSTRARASSAKARVTTKHELWSHDEHGRYSTHGANSVATVLGTKWQTVESCAGTLTRVVQGQVRVRDLHRRATVLLRAGHSYLARR